MRKILLATVVCAAFRADAGTEVCDLAAEQISQETGVPVSVLKAITRTETGRKRAGKFVPWPWTVNMEGAGKWFDTTNEALAYVRANMNLGKRSFDVGCFQLNYRWHGQAFASIEQMFDPIENARYAAQFLQSLHDETGDWVRAAGFYHSRTPKYARRYEKIFARHYASADDLPQLKADFSDVPPANEPLAISKTAAKPRVNRYPLINGGAGRGASLVPTFLPARALIAVSG